ncbi:MAG: non-heme iron oxygenase ferredoxin subunit [Rhodospirillales bacterium]|nr:non-heme iron oxygenase ferredoxin subunit [Rhodospirillales bacterium]MDE2197507.1 non-heme iron oxygenase ferredoxin subunit [Rhodospirillales bacterium]MDE2575708.1 non-heme iron oxygenase ferredoxin subunit [Rhodospirillales bacterium]
MSEAENWVRVAALGDVAAGTVVGVEAMGLNLAVYHLESGEVCVTDNVCTHAFALLSDGWFENGTIECPLHAGQFDVRTGKGLGAPVEEDLRVFRTRVEDGAILIELPG